MYLKRLSIFVVFFIPKGRSILILVTIKIYFVYKALYIFSRMLQSFNHSYSGADYLMRTSKVCGICIRETHIPSDSISMKTLIIFN